VPDISKDTSSLINKGGIGIKSFDGHYSLINGCPTLATAEENQGEWHFSGVEDSLELIQELGAQGEGVVLEWPEGKPFELVGNVSFNNCRLNIKGGED